jgi:hypothetical protein
MLRLILDPNICIAAANGHPHSAGLLDDIHEDRKYLKLIIDDTELIWYEYQSIVSQLGDRQKIWLKWILENKELYVESKSIELTGDSLSILHELGCDRPVEPQLLSLCWTYKNDLKLLIAGPDCQTNEVPVRGICKQGILEKLKENMGIDLTIWDSLYARRKISDYIKYDPPYPSNEDELDELLEENEFQENDHLEFKQAQSECLTQSILIKGMPELCAFANTNGGILIFGIKEYTKHIGTKVGFELYYKSDDEKIKKPKSIDEFDGIFATNPKLLNHMKPLLKAPVLQHKFIKLKNGKYVLIFYIKKVGEKILLGNKFFIRLGAHTIQVGT